MSDSKEIKFWNERYIKEEIPWDINQAAPSFINYFTKIKNLEEKKIAVLGCGKGHDAFGIANLGAWVHGFDFAREAIKFCNKKKQSMKNIDFFEKDFFKLNKDLLYKEQYDFVLEHTSFCAIDPIYRKEYIEIIKYLLKPNGILVGLFFIHPTKETGPPYAIKDLNTLREYLKNDFTEKELNLGNCLHFGLSLEEKEYFGVFQLNK